MVIRNDAISINVANRKGGFSPTLSTEMGTLKRTPTSKTATEKMAQDAYLLTISGHPFFIHPKLSAAQQFLDLRLVQKRFRKSNRLESFRNGFDNLASLPAFVSGDLFIAKFGVDFREFR